MFNAVYRLFFALYSPIAYLFSSKYQTNEGGLLHSLPPSADYSLFYQTTINA